MSRVWYSYDDDIPNTTFVDRRDEPPAVPEGEPAEAELCWRAILTPTRPDKFASVDMGIYGHLTRRNLAVLSAKRGDHEEEERLWRALLAECSGDREAPARPERLANALQGAPAR